MKRAVDIPTINNIPVNPTDAFPDVISVPLQPVANFAGIGVSTTVRFITVDVDENNENRFSMYFHNGVALFSISLQPV